MVSRTGTKTGHARTKISYTNATSGTSYAINNKDVKRESLALLKIKLSLIYSYTNVALIVSLALLSLAQFWREFSLRPTGKKQQKELMPIRDVLLLQMVAALKAIC